MSDIGTDATMASHIQTIMDRKYAQKINDKLYPTPLGKALYEAYESVGCGLLNRPDLRAEV